MNRIPVTSNALVSVGYDPATMTLEVEIHGGTVYQYLDVPETVFQALMASDSLGRFFNQNIKNQFRYSRL
jgi:hypothetical protein